VNKKILVKLCVSLSISFTLAVFFFFLARTKTYQILELKALDLKFALKGNKVTQTPILHIDIDDQSLAKLGRWPWPRNYHAKLIDTLKECQANAVLMDVLFTEEVKDNPQEDTIFANSIKQAGMVYLPFYFIEDQVAVSRELRSLLSKDINLSIEKAAEVLKVDPGSIKDHMPLAKKAIIDEVVRGLIRKDPDMSLEGLLQRIEEEKGWFLFSEDEGYISEDFQKQRLSRLFINKFGRDYPAQDWPYKKEYKSFNVPIAAFIESMKGSGFINADPDIDGVTRKVPLFIRYEDKILPQLTVAALMDYLSVKDIEAKSGFLIFKNADINGRSKDIKIPVDNNGCMLVNWQGRWGYSFKHIPYYLILRLQEVREQLRMQLNTSEGQDRALSQSQGGIEYLKNSENELKEKLTAMVKGRICIIGLTATGTHDLRPIPLQENYPMVGTHSNLINTILTQNFIRRKAGGINILIFFFTALVIGFSSLVKLRWSMVLTVFYAVGYFLVSFWLFVKLGFSIDLVGPAGILVFGFSAITSFRYFTEEKEKLWIKQAFSHYLSKEVINELMDDPSKLKLGGEKRPVTVIFTDIRGFTAFSESHQPEEVVAMLNELLSEQVKVVFKYNGTLDKFVGDELMAFFGAPGEIHAQDHAIVAVRTAIDIQIKLKELKEKWAKENKEALYIGIGINTGDVVVGNMGSSERMDYTVIGDNVNLAARLCSAAGGAEILISESTYEQVKKEVKVEKLEPISVKGKAKPVSIYRVISLA
jgi:adenylate cyclase